MISDLTRCSEQTENKAMKRTNLRSRCTPACLPLADHMNRFIAGDRAPGSPERAEMLACMHPAFDGPMVLFQDIIEVLHRAMPAIFHQSTLGFELPDGWRIPGVLVGIDYARRGMVLSAQGFREKALSRC